VKHRNHGGNENNISNQLAAKSNGVSAKSSNNGNGASSASIARSVARISNNGKQ